MRNLKRALSLLLSSTMVLGMLVMGSSAQSFTDAEDISNVEAVTIVDGLDVMNGYPDGSFKPEGIVTRAEMAVVISKMLYGPEFNPANFEGAGTFTDTPDWAEGYINLCASLDIIAGRGNGIFDPNATVTTSEAAAMFLRTLGYLQTSEEFGTDWQLAVTSKATNLGLYGDLKLSINEGLSRENVAEMAFNTLFAQRVAYDDYRGLYVKANDRNVVVTNGTSDELNTLANNTFGLYTAEGVVTGNGYTDKTLMADDKSGAETRVVFTDPVDLDRDGKVNDTDYEFEYETGLDMIGHAVTIYYSIEDKDYNVFTMVDESVLTGVIYAGASKDMADAANALGFKKNTVMDVIDADKAILNYDVDVNVLASDIGPSNTYADNALLLVSNSANEQVDYVIVLDQKLNKISDVDTDDDEIEYTLEVAETYDELVPTAAFDEDDYVITTNIGNTDDVVVVEPANVISSNISKLVGKSNDGASTTLKTVIADGNEYTESPVAWNGVSDTTNFQAITTIGSTTLVLDTFGKLIGLATAPAVDIGYAYVAQYGEDHVKTEDGLNMKTVLTALIYYADGTNEVRVVDKDDSWSSINTTYAGGSGLDTLNSNGTTTYNSYIGIFYVTENSDDSVVLTAPAARANVYDTTTDFDDVKVTTGHSLQMKDDGTIIYKFGDGATVANRIYANEDSVYFYVDGTYAGGDLSVVPKVGIANAVGFTDDQDGVDVKQVDTKHASGSRNTVEAMLVDGVELGDSTTVYYYNQNDFEVTAEDGGTYAITFNLRDVNGQLAPTTYGGYEDAATARSKGQSYPSGYYTVGAKQLNVVTGTEVLVNSASGQVANDTNEDEVKKGNMVYATDAKAVAVISNYDNYAGNLFAEFASTVNYGVIFDDSKVVDMTGNGLNTVAKIVSAVGKGATIEISYSYNANTFVAGVVYVTSYVPAVVVGPGSDADRDIKVATMDTAGGIWVSVNDSTFSGTKDFDIELYEYSRDLGEWILVHSQDDVTFTFTAGNANIDWSGHVISGNRYYAVVGGYTTSTVVHP